MTDRTVYCSPEKYEGFLNTFKRWENRVYNRWSKFEYSFFHIFLAGKLCFLEYSSSQGEIELGTIFVVDTAKIITILA